MQFHVLSFEGPDDYARVGRLEKRVNGLVQALTELGHEAHLWFIGDPKLVGNETREGVHLHRWCQWLSRYKSGGAYDGEEEKASDFARSLPPFLFHNYLRPTFLNGERAVVIAEEWQTASSILHLDWYLQQVGMRPLVNLIWNANSTFGLDRIDWSRLSRAACITTASRYLKQQVQRLGSDAVVVPNGLPADAYDLPDPSVVARFREAFIDRVVITKMGRWDPDGNWLASIAIVSELKRQGYRPIFFARGGSEPHGDEVFRAIKNSGLIVIDRINSANTLEGLLLSHDQMNDIDVINLRSRIEPASRRALFRASDIVLDNSGYEPFGMLGLEAMAVGGVVCTGNASEDYVDTGRNTLVLPSGTPEQFVELYRQVVIQPEKISAIRRAGRVTAEQYAWPKVIRRDFIPRINFAIPSCA
ncbi:MAG: glycosyltransferase family 4 protein [Deltaproteobacteria bacterium]|nr:glycosyltransferase family 4 protein [Deltaproteobacteria bacterium]